jgi:hypothetical protein
MSASASHANAATPELLGLSAQQRIRAIRSERGVSYPRVQKTLQILEQILDQPRTTRMPSIAIFGDSGMGKTMLMQKFCTDHPPGVDAETERHRTPVLALQMTSRPGERRFYAQILDALGAPHNPGARIVDAERAALNLLRAAQIQILVIDEVHNIFSGSYREQRTMLNMLRFISNDLKASLVCFGVMDEVAYEVPPLLPIDEGPSRSQGADALADLGGDAVAAGLGREFQAQTALDLRISVRKLHKDCSKALHPERCEVVRGHGFLGCHAVSGSKGLRTACLRCGCNGRCAWGRGGRGSPG